MSHFKMLQEVGYDSYTSEKHGVDKKIKMNIQTVWESPDFRWRYRNHFNESKYHKDKGESNYKKQSQTLYGLIFSAKQKNIFLIFGHCQ